MEHHEKNHIYIHHIYNGGRISCRDNDVDCAKHREVNMKERLSKLIDVKSIMTIVLTAGFVALTCQGSIDSQQYLSIYTMIVGFYFGTQTQKG